MDDLQAQLDVTTDVATFFVATVKAMIAVIESPTSEGARNSFVQSARHNIGEIEKRIKIERVPPPEDAK